MAGRFTKLELLGSGTFGRAWLVKNNSTGKNYVCKEVTVSGMTEKAKEQSLTEVAALAKCKHLNVIRYRQAFVDKGMLNIIMEYADAGKKLMLKFCGYISQTPEFFFVHRPRPPARKKSGLCSSGCLAFTRKIKSLCCISSTKKSSRMKQSIHY